VYADELTPRLVGADGTVGVGAVGQVMERLGYLSAW
jgi:hypothetical protein